MTTYYAPMHAGMGYPAFVDPGPTSPRRVPGSSTTPRVDDPLVRPETREEIVRGRKIHAAPAMEPHADRHQVLGFVTSGCIAPGYIAATDLLTRVGPRSNFATDTCIRRAGIDPDTGARYLEELAFEIVSAQSHRDITERAEDLSTRGVRRIVAIFVKRGEVCEWSAERNDWMVLDPNGVFEDPTLAEPIPIRAMLDQAEADQTVVWGLRTKGNPAIQTIETRAKEEGRAEGHAEGRAEGHAEGRAEGHAEGRAEGSRTAIEALCDVLGIPLGPERHGHIRRLDARALNGLLDHLRHERRWPGSK